MSLSTKPYKGARDFYPEDKRIQSYIFSVWSDVCQQFGYEGYDAPILEPTELYLSKGNEEIITEQTYTFSDRGGRSVTIRTEMTPSVSRMVAGRRQELAYPLRWYAIPNCWRYERTQRGRGREFYQLNVDLFGVAGTAAEFEMITIADTIMQRFNADRSMYVICLNNRRLTNYLLQDYAGFDPQTAHAAATLIDRKKKLAADDFTKQLAALCTAQQRQSGVIERLETVLDCTELADLPEELLKHPSVEELARLLNNLKQSGIQNITFDASLMRGFDYYTGVVFEVHDTHPENNRSMFGGGRYDDLVSLFGVAAVPTVGFAMGDITTLNFLESHELLPADTSETDVYVLLIGDIAIEAQSAIQELRALGLRVAVDISGRKLGDQLKTATKKSIRWALTIGPDELVSGSYRLKDLHSGNESAGTVNQLHAVILGQKG
jgi:histidyl-tRNA synthetase